MLLLPSLKGPIVMVLVLVSVTKATMVVNADTMSWRLNTRASVRQTQPKPPAAAANTLQDTLHRMDKISLDQLVIFTGMIKPYSCSCVEAGHSCQVEIPEVPFHKVLNVSCGHLHIYCCMKAKRDPDQENSPINMYQNTTTAEELGSFLDSMIYILRPQENKILVGNTNQAGKDLQVEFHYLYDHRPQHAKKDVRVNEEKEEISILTDHIIMKRIHNIEDGLSIALKGVVLRLFAVSAQQQMIKTSREKRTNTFPTENEIQEFDSASENEIKKFDSPSENEIKESDSKSEIGNILYSHIQESQLNGENNTSNAMYEIDDFAVPYNDLGWFSKVVENGMNLSFAAVIITVVMVMASQVLVGAFYIIDEICFVCKLIGYANVASVS